MAHFRNILLSLFLLLFAPSSALLGDVFKLKQGGQIVGVLIERGNKGEYVVRTDEGALVTLEKRQVRKVVRVSDDLLEYRQRSRTLPDTAEAHRRLAEWCQQQQLSRQRKHHMERILQLQPNDEQARTSLGYQKHNGRWLTRDQIMQQRGLQMHEGDYRTPQEIALRMRRRQHEQTDADWYNKLKLWRRWLDKRNRDEALQNFEAVDDSAAAPALIRLIEKERNLEVLELYLSVLGELSHPAAVEKLVELSIHDSDDEIRETCLDSLLRNHQPLPLEPYTKALLSRDNLIVRNAAKALHRIENPEAISPLIDALVTTHKYHNPNAPPGEMNASFSPSGGGGGLAMGGSKNKIIQVDERNEEVLRALIDLSGGQSYEYNEEAWRRWYINTQIYENVDARRDN